MVFALSRMTRYLKQTAQFSKVQLDSDGSKKLNEYGEPVYSDPITVKCRRERYQVKATAAYGAFVNYQHTYYLDDAVEPSVDDLLDGEKIQNVERYVDGLGKLVGYEVMV